MLICPQFSNGQKTIVKTEPSNIVLLKEAISYLSSDSLGGRLTGTQGETLAANYIESKYKTIGLSTYKSSKYTWDFSFKDGKRIATKAYFKVFDKNLAIGSDIILMPYGNSNKFKGAALPNVDEPDNVWLVSMKQLNTDVTNTPFKILYEKAADCIKKGASGVVFFNDIDAKHDINLLNHPKFETLDASVVVMNHKAYLNYLKPNIKKDWIEIEGQLGYEDADVHGKNVVGFINNQAPYTMMLCADYDHLGTNTQVYHGANNNASGVASLIALAELIKNSGLRNYNFLFVAFSGSEFKDQGALAFLRDNSKFMDNFNCVIDLNMLGRFNKTTKALYVSGIGTSPSWSMALQKHNTQFNLRVDSAGIGYGAYSLFYKKNLPVLSVSTGYETDFSKPNDDVSKINFTAQADINQYLFKVISEIDRLPKLAFLTTNNMVEKLESLKNDIGIIPDVTFEEDGIRVAACLTNKLAFKAGIEPDDVILQIAEFSILDLDDYCKAMNKLSKGREVPITVRRGKSEFRFFVAL